MKLLLHFIVLVASIARIAKGDSGGSKSSKSVKSVKSGKGGKGSKCSISSSGDEGCNSNSVTITLDSDPRADPGNVTVALFGCTNSENAIILAPGGIVPISSNTMIAEYLANKGYLVAVIEHYVSFGFGPPVIFASPVDVSNTINMIGANYHEPDNIILLGHSIGAASLLLGLTGFCPFCTTPFFNLRDEHENIQGAIGFGASLYDVRVGEWSPATNMGVPFYQFIGTGDTISFGVDLNGDNQAQGTYDRLVPTKVYTLVENLDHFSIANEFGIRPGDIPSNRTRNEQIDIVGGMVVLFIEVLRCEESSNETPYQFCDEFNREFGGVINDCQDDIQSTLL